MAGGVRVSPVEEEAEPSVPAPPVPGGGGETALAEGSPLEVIIDVEVTADIGESASGGGILMDGAGPSRPPRRSASMSPTCAADGGASKLAIVGLRGVRY